METTTEGKTAGQEWQWRLVGNIVEEHKYGEAHVSTSPSCYFDFLI